MMSVEKIKLIISALVICFLSYSCNSVRNDEVASANNKFSENKEIKQQSVDEKESDKKKIASNEITKINEVRLKEGNNPNLFNRLFKVKKKNINKKIIEDGIHDYSDPGARMLQNPSEAFSGFPKARGGNSIDWVKAQEMGKIKPYSDLYDHDVEPLVMDLNIVREVKGTMPDVVFPHKPHTKILDCTNCHPGIFIPQKGANQMSMAMNLMGKKCGVCHGKVAFPLSRCTSCHSKKKPQKELKKTKWTWP